MTYTKEAIKGLSWTSLLRFSIKAVGFLEMLILARVLSPNQFGAYGIALLALGLLEVLTETGTNVILIQEKTIEEHIDSAWIISIIRGVFISFVIVVTAPFVAAFFHAPNSLILIYLIGIVPVLRGFANPSTVKFQKELQFKNDLLFQLPTIIIDTLVSITVCYFTKSPIGIAVGLISGVIVQLVLSFLMIRPLPKPQFNRKQLYNMFHAGKWVTVSGVFNYLFCNADNLVVGRILGPTSLGVYQMAYSLSIVPLTEISDIFSRVMFPIFAKTSRDKLRLRQTFITSILSIFLLTLPYTALLILFTEKAILILLGVKWLTAATILPILAVAGVIRATSGFAPALFLALKKQKYVATVTLVTTIGLLIPIIPLIIHSGLTGAAISVLIGSLLALPVIVYYTAKAFSSTR